MRQKYQDRVCIVTGSASGIGKATSEALLAQGARVVAVDLDLQALTEWAAGYAQVKLEIAALNVTDYEGFSALVERTVQSHGRLDYLFNIAGISIVGEAHELTIGHWRKVLDVDLNGVVYGSSIAYRLMVKQGHGHIVNLASIQGLIPLPMEAPYVTAKYGVVGLSHALRVEGAEHGVKVSVVCPGFVKTAIFTKSEVVALDRKKHIEGLSAFEKGGVTAEECAQTILHGVAKNKPTIMVTRLARSLWWLSRLSPKLLMSILGGDLKKERAKRVA